MSIKNVLVEEFNDEVAGLSKLSLGSDEYKATVDGVTKLADRIIKIDEIEKEAEAKDRDRSVDSGIKQTQTENDYRDKLIRNGIEVVKVVGGFSLAAWAFVASMNFEKEGTLTTEGGRSSLRQLLKFIKF